MATQGTGGAVELKKTQTTIHQLMGSSSTAGWERERGRLREKVGEDKEEGVTGQEAMALFVVKFL